MLAALGAYFLCAGAALTVLMPLQYSLPMFGTIDYGHPLVTVLAIVTALGGAAAAAVASSFGGVRALLAIALLWLAGAASVIAPFVAEGSRAWIPPSDLSGLMTATALTMSELIALPAMLAGALLAKGYLRVGASPPDLLAAAGAYYVAASLMALATPHLDPRLTLPCTAGYLPAEWHALVTAVPGFVAGVFVAPVAAGAWRPAAIGAVVGLAGALPIELAALASPIRPYWPVSLVGVPVATAALVTAGAWLRDWSHQGIVATTRPFAAGDGRLHRGGRRCLGDRRVGALRRDADAVRPGRFGAGVPEDRRRAEDRHVPHHRTRR